MPRWTFKARAVLAFAAFVVMSVADRRARGSWRIMLLRDISFTSCALLTGALPGDAGGWTLARFFLGLGLSGADLLRHSREGSLLLTILFMQLLRVVTD